MSHFKKLFVILAALVAASAASANPYFTDGNRLHTNCQSQTGDVRYTACQQYVVGVIDGSFAVNSMFYCWPEAGTVGQAVDIVKKWLEDNPSLRTMEGGNVVVAALKEAFPTKVMWQPPQEDANGDYQEVPLTSEKSTDEGKWVGTCSGEIKYDMDEIFRFALALPENYKVGKAWFWEMLRGVE